MTQTVSVVRWGPAFLLGLAMTTGKVSAHDLSPSRCGGFVREVGPAHVEVTARGRQIEVRVADHDGRPARVRGSVALAVDGEAKRFELSTFAPGLLVATAQSGMLGDAAVVWLAFPNGVQGSTRFPLRAYVGGPSCTN